MRSDLIGRRRVVLGLAAAAALAACRRRPPRAKRSIVLRSSWQTVNIGDVAHSPGALALFERWLPEVGATLWPNDVDREVRRLLRRRFPRIAIVEGSLDEAGEPNDEALISQLGRADLLIHGSGSGMPGWREVTFWRDRIRRPYGFLGVSLWQLGESTRALAAAARFLYCRDSTSLRYAHEQNLPTPVVGLCPDAAFAFDARDDERALAFIAREGLRPGGYVCVVPRLRTTPYETMRAVRDDDAEVERRRDDNALAAAEDHAKLREAIIAYVRRSGGRVVVCPEMTYQLGVMDALVVDPLPADVRVQVVARRRWWLPDEAASLYARAAAVVSIEMHSPILAVAAGTPAVYLRQPTDTVKGQMWRDVGLGEWMFELERDRGDAVAAALLAITMDPARARRRVDAAMNVVRERHAVAMGAVRSALGLAPAG